MKINVDSFFYYEKMKQTRPRAAVDVEKRPLLSLGRVCVMSTDLCKVLGEYLPKCLLHMYTDFTLGHCKSLTCLWLWVRWSTFPVNCSSIFLFWTRRFVAFACFSTISWCSGETWRHREARRGHWGWLHHTRTIEPFYRSTLCSAATCPEQQWPHPRNSHPS